MVSSVCGASILFRTGLFPSQLANCQKIKEETQQKESGKHRATSKLEKNFFKHGSPKTTSNTGGGEQGEGGSWAGFMCAHVRGRACECACITTWHQVAEMHLGYAAPSPSAEKKKRLSARIKSLECVCVSSRSGRPLQHPESTSAQRLPRRRSEGGPAAHTHAHAYSPRRIRAPITQVHSHTQTHTSNHTLHALLLCINQSGY